MNDLRSCKLHPLDAINNSGLWILLMILSRELMALNVVNNTDCRWHERLWVMSLGLKML